MCFHFLSPGWGHYSMFYIFTEFIFGRLINVHLSGKWARPTVKVIFHVIKVGNNDCNWCCNRQLMVMEETHVINQMKEDACFVSQDFFKDMEIARFFAI